MESTKSPLPEYVLQALDKMKSQCVIQDDQYWNLSVFMTQPFTENGVWNVIEQPHAHELHFTLPNGFSWKANFLNLYRFYFNGYVTLSQPQWFPHLSSLLKEFSYDDLGYTFHPLPVELTYQTETTIGWDHAHGYDHPLNKPLTVQPSSDFFPVHVTGPVQIFQECYDVMSRMIKVEEEWKQEQCRTILRQWEEELMQKVWHPQRIQKWLSIGGMDL